MPKRNYKTKSEVIYQKLKKDILKEKYKPHERIILSTVARKFNSSEIPVREAIRLLSADGLVINKPYVGAVVKRIDLEDITKLYDIRKILEVMAAKMAVEKIKKKDVVKLENTIKLIEVAFNEKKYESVSRLYKNFYSTIYSNCDNDYLYKVIFYLWNLSFRNPGLLSSIPGRDKQSIQGLKKIVKALKKSDRELVARLIAKQKENALAAWQIIYKTNNSQ